MRVVQLLELPEPVTGSREIRYPKMAAAQATAEGLMTDLRETNAPNKSGKPAR